MQAGVGGGPAASRHRAGSRGRLWPWVAVAATVGTIGLGLYALGLREDLRRARAGLQAAESRAAQADALRDSLAGLLADVTLSGTSPDVAGRAHVLMDVDGGRALLLVDDLPVLPPDQVYQLWAILGGEPIDAGAFRLEREGFAWIALEGATDLSEADRLAVTVEQAPGSSAPTGDPILAGGT